MTIIIYYVLINVVVVVAMDILVVAIKTLSNIMVAIFFVIKHFAERY